VCSNCKLSATISIKGPFRNVSFARSGPTVDNVPTGNLLSPSSPYYARFIDLRTQRSGREEESTHSRRRTIPLQARPGTGLGLATCRKVVRLLCGGENGAEHNPFFSEEVHHIEIREAYSLA
jgi:hypothetical protein